MSEIFARLTVEENPEVCVRISAEDSANLCARQYQVIEAVSPTIDPDDSSGRMELVIRDVNGEKRVALPGTDDYEDLNNKPQVNSVELVGNKTLDDLGIQPEGEYADEPLTNMEIEAILNSFV